MSPTNGSRKRSAITEPENMDVDTEKDTELVFEDPYCDEFEEEEQEKDNDGACSLQLK